jgi:ribosomal protein S19E (S16A)
MQGSMKPGKAIKPKDRCCKSRPRCDRCPVVLRRLEAQGYVERSKKGRFVVTAKVKKKHLKAARA